MSGYESSRCGVRWGWMWVLGGLMIGGCGPGKFGSSVEVLLGGGVSDPASQWSPDARRLALTPPFLLEVTRACVSVSGAGEQDASVTLMPAGTVTALHRFVPPGGVLKEDCFCHGNPPHCHGDCSDRQVGSGSSGQTVIGDGSTVVNLSAAHPQTVLTGGAVPGAYSQVLMTYGSADSALAVPPECGDMAGRAFLLEGTLVNQDTGDATEITVDLRVGARVTDVLTADTPAVAESGTPARLRVMLLLDALLAGVDWAPLGVGSGSAIVVGGELQNHPVVVSEIMAALQDQANYIVEPL